MSGRKDETSCPPPAEPKMCANNCGFFGAGELNLCSKCHKEHMRTQEQDRPKTPLNEEPPTKASKSKEGDSPKSSPQPKEFEPADVPAIEVELPKAVSVVAEASASSTSAPKPLETKTEEQCVPIVVDEEAPKDDKPEEPKVQTNKSRCWSCNKKIGIMGFECRCGYFYCGKHRYAEEHDCPFDYKTTQRAQLSEQNQQVIADKLERI